MRCVQREGFVVEGGWIEQVIDLLAVDLKKRDRDGITTCGFELRCLLEKPFGHFWNNAVQLPHLLRSLLALHCEGLPRSSLPIGENSTMISLQGLIDHLIDPALPKHLVLITLLRQQIITAKGLLMRFIPHNHLFALETDGYLGVAIMLCQLCGEEGADAKCGLDGRHLSFIIRSFDDSHMVMIWVRIRLCPNACNN